MAIREKASSQEGRSVFAAVILLQHIPCITLCLRSTWPSWKVRGTGPVVLLCIQNVRFRERSAIHLSMSNMHRKHTSVDNMKVIMDIKASGTFIHDLLDWRCSACPPKIPDLGLFLFCFVILAKQLLFLLLVIPRFKIGNILWLTFLQCQGHLHTTVLLYSCPWASRKSCCAKSCCLYTVHTLMGPLSIKL